MLQNITNKQKNMQSNYSLINKINLFLIVVSSRGMFWGVTNEYMYIEAGFFVTLLISGTVFGTDSIISVSKRYDVIPDKKVNTPIKTFILTELIFAIVGIIFSLLCVKFGISEVYRNIVDIMFCVALNVVLIRTRRRVERK